MAGTPLTVWVYLVYCPEGGSAGSERGRFVPESRVVGPAVDCPGTPG